MSDSVHQITDAEFEQEVLQHSGDVLAYFWAPWCGPCRLMSPIINWAAGHYSDLKIVKLEVDPNPESVARCKVEGVPALVLFRDGQPIDSIEGAIAKPKLSAMLDSHLSSAT
ncbi:MAG: thioredoxin family protein [Leptolyngbyaceae bacterium]|nr:thioredoxin family protein [Leptolyngbyaceae bacterium]